MAKKLGMPYMGSKRNYAERIVDHILKHNPKCKYVYDLFGGGGAFSFEALQRCQIEKVFYNEIDAGVVALLRDIQEHGVTEKYYQWIDRKTFHENKFGDDWLAGLCKVVWSFGNNPCKGYLFGEHVEEYKKNYHEVVVFGIDKLKEMSDYCEKYVFEKYGISEKCVLEMPTKKDYQERRLEIRKQITEYERACKSKQSFRLGDLQQLEQLQQLERLQQLEGLQQLQQLQQLQRLQRLQRLQQLEISCLSYDKVQIETPVEETIIYLDPPYIGTASYKNVIDYEKLYEYMRNSKYKIYMSSYESPFLEVASWKATNKFISLKKEKRDRVEKLFCNREESIIKEPSLFDC